MSNFYNWQLDGAASMFPLMPKAVFDIFLRPLILTDMGWPYRSIKDVLSHSSPWYYVFHPFSLEDIAKMHWHLESARIGRDALSPQCVDDIDLVLKNYLGRLPRTANYDYDDCRNRTRRQLDYIRQHGCVPADPIVAAELDGKLKLLDGNHRIAAAWHSGLVDPIFSLWRGVLVS